MPDKLLEWNYLGSIRNATSCSFGGVYLITHQGIYNRVVYVGTSSSIGQRLLQHYVGYERGDRSIWRIAPSEDPYELMSAVHVPNFIKYFKQLAESNRVWASTTVGKLFPSNLLMPCKPFSEEWKAYVLEEYLPKLGVWALRLDPYLPKRALMIESAIQQRLVALFELGRFFNHRDLSVLGKIEINSHLVRIRDLFKNTPDLDEASKLVFENLHGKHLPEASVFLAREQLATVISERLKKKESEAQKREALLSAYPRQGSPWEAKDCESLRVMLVDFQMSAEEMSEHLMRSPSSIHKAIAKNDRLTKGRWRTSINELS